MKRIFMIDWTLIPLFTLTTYSGIELHIVGHEGTHEIWHNWAVFHIIASFLFLIYILFHISTHWNWYKGLLKKGIGRKSKVTLCLSIIFFIITITGIILFFIEGNNSLIGLWHYKIGLVMSLFSVWHLIKRFNILCIPIRSKAYKKNVVIK